MIENVPAKYFIYADDDNDDRQTIADMIAKVDSSLDVVTAENGLGVVNYLRSLQPSDVLPCFILLDINMPVMNGFKTLEFLKSKDSFKNIPVIVFTTSSHPKDVQLAKQLGAEKFMTKPFSSAEITEITHQFADLCHTLPVKRIEAV